MLVCFLFFCDGKVGKDDEVSIGFSLEIHHESNWRRDCRTPAAFSG